MANASFYDKKDVPQFQEDVCKKTCIMNGACLDKYKGNTHWFLMCPHYHSWKLGYGSFVWDLVKWEKEHPAEAAAKHAELVERAKKWKAEQKKKK